MTDPISNRQFSEADGVSDWRALFWGAKALYRTGSFAEGAEFVAAIAIEAAALGASPNIDLREDTVTVGLGDRNIDFARRISQTAARLGLTADPAALQHAQLTIDVADREPVLEFWRAALGHERIGDEYTVHPNFTGPTIWFQEKQHVPPRNRIHVDLSLPHDVAEQRVAAILAAGGRLLGDKHAPSWWSLIDPEGNVVDVCTWQPPAHEGA